MSIIRLNCPGPVPCGTLKDDIKKGVMIGASVAAVVTVISVAVIAVCRE